MYVLYTVQFPLSAQCLPIYLVHKVHSCNQLIFSVYLSIYNFLSLHARQIIMSIISLLTPLSGYCQYIFIYIYQLEIFIYEERGRGNLIIGHVSGMIMSYIKYISKIIYYNGYIYMYIQVRQEGIFYDTFTGKFTFYFYQKVSRGVGQCQWSVSLPLQIARPGSNLGLGPTKKAADNTVNIVLIKY